MKKIFVIGRTLLPFVMIFLCWSIHLAYFQPSIPAVTLEFRSWVNSLEEQYNKEALSDDVFVDIEFHSGKEVRNWKFASSEIQSKDILIRVLQLVNESGFIRPSDANMQSLNESDGYLAINALEQEKSFKTIISLQEVRENIQAMNLLILLQNRV